MLLESWKRSSAAFEDYRDRYTPEAFLDTVLTLESDGGALKGTDG
jgi:hypothetical protein